MKELLAEHFWAHGFLAAQYATGFLQLHHRTASETAELCTDGGIFLPTWCWMPFSSWHSWEFPLRSLCSHVNTLAAHTYPEQSKLNKRAYNRFYTWASFYTSIKPSCSHVSWSWVLYKLYHLLLLLLTLMLTCLTLASIHEYRSWLVGWRVACFWLDVTDNLLSHIGICGIFKVLPPFCHSEGLQKHSEGSDGIFWSRYAPLLGAVGFYSAFTFWSLCFYSSTYKTLSDNYAPWVKWAGEECRASHLWWVHKGCMQTRKRTTQYASISTCSFHYFRGLSFTEYIMNM